MAMCAFQIGLFLLAGLSIQGRAFAQDAEETPSWAKPAEDRSPPPPSQGGEAEREELEAELESRSPRSGVRQFHQVLDDLLLEFGYDIAQGQLSGLKNLSIRQVSVNDALPKSYEGYLELLLAERIRENSKVRMIACLPCKSRKSALIDGRLTITSPKTNVAHLNAAAEQLGIQFFMDATLVYHSTHMVLAFEIFDISTKELVWARAYNSETIRSRFQRMAIDYKQVAKSRVSDEYQPEYKFLAGFATAMLPNVNKEPDDSTLIGLQIRATEKFNHRRSEFGLIAGLMSTTSALLPQPSAGSDTTDSEETAEGETETDADSDAEIKPFKHVMTLFAVYAHNFFGRIESYDEIRQGVHVGAGPLISSGYYTAAVRVGYDLYFGRSWALTVGGMHLMGSRVVSGDQIVKTSGGAGADLVMSFNF